MTDKGRKLKEKGSLAEFRKWEQKESEDLDLVKSLQTQSLVSNINSVKFQKQMVVANILIAIATMAAALYYFLEIRENHSDFYEAIFPFAITALFALISTAIIWMLITNNRKYHQGDRIAK